MKLPNGHNRYGLEDDGCWLHDPFNPAIETNEYGELNSVVEIKPRGRAAALIVPCGYSEHELPIG